MIKKLRLRIEAISMLVVLLIMITMVVVVNLITISENNSMADDSIDYHYSVSKSLKDDPEYVTEVEKSNTGYDFHISNEEGGRWWRYIIVWYGADGSKDTIVLGSRYISDEDAVEFIERAERKGETKGWVDYYRFGKFYEADGSGFLILNPSESERSRIDSMFQSTILTAGICFVVMFVMVIFFSKQVVKPIHKMLDNQKRFITDGGHELKTPITIISANNDIMEMNYGESSITQSSRSQLKRMSVLIQKLIDMSKMDEDIDFVNKEKFSLDEAVYDTIMSYKEIAENLGKKVELYLDKAVELDNDETKARQIISILMDNAIKYCDESGIISVRLTRGKKPVLTVENSYSDIDSVSLSKLFERFYREDRARTGGNGYGLGLSIAYSICEACGFSIKAKKSDEGKIMFIVKFS